jgi:hypothetical protein
VNLKRYVLIAGQGRSGTNWLLEILDRSPRTYCRNEPNECIGSALDALPEGGVAFPELESKLGSMWDTAITRASNSFSDRDLRINVYKDYFSRPLQRMGLVRVVGGPRCRNVLGSVIPSFRRTEWPIPSWLQDKRQQEPALPILKLNMVPGWIVWALRHRPEAQVLHIVRHPGGYLNSLISRWWSSVPDMKAVEQINRERLIQVAAADRTWGERFGDVSALSPVETELWYWRYACETIHQFGEGNPRYQLVKYEELACNPVETSRAIYQRFGLDWDDAIEQAIRQSSLDARASVSAWRSKLNAEQIATVDWVLRDSSMRDLWSGTEPAAGGPNGAANTSTPTRLKSCG